MAFEHVLFEAADDGIAVLTVNRPAKLNALNGGVLAELDEVLQRMESDPALKALIVTGAGEKAFVAGADINELAAASPIDAHGLSLKGQRLFRRLELLPKPSVAAVNGFALGGGLELAMACTLRVASPNARLGQPEVKLGIVAGYGATQRLPRLVGRGRALEMLLTGEPVDAAEAHRIGLVNRVVEQGELLGYSRALLLKMLANGPVAVRLTMEAVDVGMSVGFEEGQRFEAAAFAMTAATADKQEGTRAFLEKRVAAFTGM
ncbi:MAG: enoyl-CoA hydratase-related protein [Bryobacteraceae bacterium]|nr:enoyl-CoA hydratase-related protein [Bryobacteraceae bacterium]